MVHTKLSRIARTAMADSCWKIGMKEWIYYIRIENSLAHYVPCEGPEDTRKKDTSIVEKVRDDRLLKTMADSRRCCYRKGLSDSSEDKKNIPV